MALFLAFCILFLLQPVCAVLTRFDNCLPDSYQFADPLPLQWVPLYFDARFDTEAKSHGLRLTVWGNVTGSRTNVTLPPAGDDLWKNASFTDGKILDNPDSDSANPKLTTLHSKIDVLTYEPWSESTDFCNASLVNATCPLGPAFDHTDQMTLNSLPSVSMSHDFYARYAFTSFSPTFLIIYGNDATTIGCVSATVTPDLGGLAWMLKFLPLMVLLSVGFATVFAGTNSTWGTLDIFHWTSNFGRQADLLRLVTPGFGDCLQYIQFVALTGGLTLNYPGFYQPIVSQACWSALMFNESFVSKAPAWQHLVDGIYYTNGTYGLQDLGQLVGMAHAEDIWAGMMVWLLVIIGGVTVAIQLGFGAQWVHRLIKNIPEEDLRNKNLPFSVGNVVRIVFNYFLLPLVALSTFQLVVSADSPGYTVALAAVTVVVLLIFAGWLLYLITTTKPRSVLFDDLPTVLLYGPLYNTYSDEAAAFALIPVLLTFVRGVAIGAVQPAGIAQIIILAICEVVQIITLHAFKPFSSPTSMNAYHTLFAAVRFTTTILMTAFIPQLGVTDGQKGWIAYAILLMHAAVLVLGFMLNALQTSIEVIARLMGAGGEQNRGLHEGPLSRIFGARQLSRRTSRRGGAASRQSQLSSSAMLSSDEAAKHGGGAGYISPGGRLRSESAGSMGVLLNHQNQRSSSALDAGSVDLTLPPSRQLDAASTLTPTTPGEASTYSFLPSPSAGQTRHSVPPSALLLEQNVAGDTFYRPPRPRRLTLENSSPTTSATKAGRGSWTGSGEWSPRRSSQPGAPHPDAIEIEEMDRGMTPAPYKDPPIPVTRADYATREVDFYYGVQRGERLNRDVPQRKLGTGPADPTGTMASAAGWFRNMLGGKRKEKGKGFEVVRSSRMPPAMRAAAGQDYEDDVPPEGIPVAMGALRNGPIDSDDDDVQMKKIPRTRPAEGASGEAHADEGAVSLLDADDDSDDVENPKVSSVPPILPDIEHGESLDVPGRIRSKASRRSAKQDEAEPSLEGAPAVPSVPRKSSKRKSDLFTSGPSSPQNASFMGHARGNPSSGSARLPFESLSRGSSQLRRPSSSSMGDTTTEDQSEIDLRRLNSERKPTSLGHVHHGSINRVPSDSRGKAEGSAAEFVDSD